MFFEQYIGELIVAIGTAATTWMISRKKQQVDTKKIEVEVLEKAIQVINKDVVAPLRESLVLQQRETESISQKLKKLQHAVSKIYNCNYLHLCPVRSWLRKQEAVDGKSQQRKQPTNRQREPVDPSDDKTGAGAGEDSDDGFEY